MVGAVYVALQGGVTVSVYSRFIACQMSCRVSINILSRFAARCMDRPATAAIKEGAQIGLVPSIQRCSHTVAHVRSMVHTSTLFLFLFHVVSLIDTSELLNRYIVTYDL